MRLRSQPELPSAPAFRAMIAATIVSLGCASERLEASLHNRVPTNGAAVMKITINPGQPLVVSAETITANVAQPDGGVATEHSPLTLTDFCHTRGVNCTGVQGNTATQICIAPREEAADFVELVVGNGDRAGWAGFQLCPTNPNIGTSPHANWISCALTNRDAIRICANAQ